MIAIILFVVLFVIFALIATNTGDDDMVAPVVISAALFLCSITATFLSRSDNLTKAQEIEQFQYELDFARQRGENVEHVMMHEKIADYNAWITDAKYKAAQPSKWAYAKRLETIKYVK